MYSLLIGKRVFRSLEDLQTDLDIWLMSYNSVRPHSGRYCYAETTWETFQANKPLSLEKDLSPGGDRSESPGLQPTAVSHFCGSDLVFTCALRFARTSFCCSLEYAFRSGVWLLALSYSCLAYFLSSSLWNLRGEM